MTMTDPALASPLHDLYDGLTRALDEEDERFQRLVDDHDLIRERILAARDNIQEAISATGGIHIPRGGANGNGHPVEGTVVVDLRNGGVPVVKPTDTVVDPRTATIGQLILAVAKSEPAGRVWRAEEMLERMRAMGYPGNNLGSIRAEMGKLVARGEFQRDNPGDFYIPQK